MVYDQHPASSLLLNNVSSLDSNDCTDVYHRCVPVNVINGYVFLLRGFPNRKQKFINFLMTFDKHTVCMFSHYACYKNLAQYYKVLIFSEISERMDVLSLRSDKKIKIKLVWLSCVIVNAYVGDN